MTYSIRIIVTTARADRLDLEPTGLPEARSLARTESLHTRCPVEVWRHEGASHVAEARYVNGYEMALSGAV